MRDTFWSERFMEMLGQRQEVLQTAACLRIRLQATSGPLFDNVARHRQRGRKLFGRKTEVAPQLIERLAECFRPNRGHPTASALLDLPGVRRSHATRTDSETQSAATVRPSALALLVRITGSVREPRGRASPRDLLRGKAVP